MATVTVKDKKDLKESRKISSDIGKAFLNKTAKKSKNSHTDGKSLYLHGHEIAKHGENGAVHGTMAGWPTKTTKDRLNAISNDRFHTKKGKHYYGDKEIGERDWVQIKEAIRIMVEGAIKDLETKDEEEKRLLKTNKPKKLMIDKERSQFKGLQKKDLKEDDETASRYKKALADSKGSITKDGEELVKKRINQLQNKDLKEGFFSGKSLKPTKAGIKRALQKDTEENSGPSGDDYQPTKKGTKLIKRLTNEGVGRYLDKTIGNQKRRIKNKLKHQNSMVSTPLSKIATNNKRLQRLEK